MSVSKDLVDIIKGSDDKGTKAYDTPATVTRVDGSTVWVHIPGGVDETPVKKTINAKQGDTVQVRVSGGSAWLNGNASAPPTDDTQANVAVEYALVAGNAAESAVKSASIASEAAADAKATADSVHGIATQALADAATAKGAADNASEYAARALGNLSTVQSVTETLTWITQHGTMALTTDVALDPTHVYFVVDAGGDYVVGGVTYAIVTEPDVDDIGTYYELTIDESLNNYVGTHLALTSEGLWLLPASTGTNKVLIATGAGSVYTTAGTYIIDSDGTTVLASFRADGVTIGQVVSGEYNTNIDSTGLDIRDNTKSIANFGTTARIGEETGASKIIISPENFTVYSKEDSQVFKTGVDTGGTVYSYISLYNEDTQIYASSTSIANGATVNITGVTTIPILNSVSNSTTFYVRLSAYKQVGGSIAYFEITGSMWFTKGTSSSVTDNNITLAYDGTSSFTASGTYTNNTGSAITLVNNKIRPHGYTSTIEVPLYETMVNGTAVFNIDGGNTVIGLPQKADNDFDDYYLYQAIVALGWGSDVMVGLSFARSADTKSVGQSWGNTVTTVPMSMPITCVSDNTSVVIVTGYDSHGQPGFKAVGAGTCTLTATIEVGGVIYSATFSATVT